MRLDKLLSTMAIATRREIKEYAKKGKITVNGVVVKDASIKVNQNEDVICFNGEEVSYKEHIYVILNKPQGYITATKDNTKKTVLDILDKKYKKLFPVGRLDKDTEGLLIFTNNGKWAHDVLSPKKHVPKTYFAHIEGLVNNEDVLKFKEGLLIDEGYKCMPANLIIIESGEISKIEVTIFEGKYHQVKRMFKAVSKKVVFLKRIAMGGLILDENLKIGEYKELTSEDVKKVTEDKFYNI